MKLLMCLMLMVVVPGYGIEKITGYKGYKLGGKLSGEFRRSGSRREPTYSRRVESKDKDIFVEVCMVTADENKRIFSISTIFQMREVKRDKRLKIFDNIVKRAIKKYGKGIGKKGAYYTITQENATITIKSSSYGVSVSYKWIDHKKLAREKREKEELQKKRQEAMNGI